MSPVVVRTVKFRTFDASSLRLPSCNSIFQKGIVWSSFGVPELAPPMQKIEHDNDLSARGRSRTGQSLKGSIIEISEGRKQRANAAFILSSNGAEQAELSGTPLTGVDTVANRIFTPTSFSLRDRCRVTKSDACVANVLRQFDA